MSLLLGPIHGTPYVGGSPPGVIIVTAAGIQQVLPTSSGADGQVLMIQSDGSVAWEELVVGEGGEFSGGTPTGIVYVAADGTLASDGPTWGFGVLGVVGSVSVDGGGQPGIYAVSSSATGVTGTSFSGMGVSGYSSTLHGVYGQSENSAAGYFFRQTDNPASDIAVVLVAQTSLVDTHAALHAVSLGYGPAILTTGDLLVEQGKLSINEASPTAQLEVESADATRQAFIARAANSQTANIAEFQVYDGTVGAHVTSAGEFSNTGGYASSEVFGSGTSQGGVENCLFGCSAYAYERSVAVGYDTTAGRYCVAVGYAAGGNSGKYDSIAIGRAATWTNDGAVAIGAYSSAAATSVALGKKAVAAAGQFVVGGNSGYHISNVYVGGGVVNTTPVDTTYHATGGSGTDVTGASLIMAPGIGTGTGAPGSFKIQIAPASGVSSDIPNTLEDALVVDAVQIPTGLLYVGANQEVKSNGPTWNGYQLVVPGLTPSGGVPLHTISEAQDGYCQFTNRFNHPGTTFALRFKKETSYYTGTTSTIGGIESFARNGVGGYVVGAGVYLKQDVAAGNYYVPHKIVFETCSSTAYKAERARITSEGFVGINETSPTAQLEVESADATRQAFIARAANSQTANIAEFQSYDGTKIIGIPDTVQTPNGVLYVDASGNLASNGPTYDGSVLFNNNFQTLLLNIYSQYIVSTGGATLKLCHATGTGNRIEIGSSWTRFISSSGEYARFNSTLFGVNEASPTAQLEVESADATRQAFIARAANSQTANIAEFQAYDGTVLAYISSGGVPFATDLQTGTIAQAHNTKLGDGCLRSITTGGERNVGIGANAGLNISTGKRNIGIGVNSQYNLRYGDDNIGLNGGGGQSHNGTIVFNGGSTASHQFVAGSNGTVTSHITDVFIGSGVTSTTPVDTTYHATGGSGENVAGANLIFMGGISTGNATPGEVEFHTSDVGSTGAVEQTTSRKGKVGANGWTFDKHVHHGTPTSNAPSGTTQAIDWTDGNNQTLDLSSATGDVTVTFTDPEGATHITLKVVQGATARDITWPASIKWDDEVGEPTWNADATKTRIVTAYFDGTSYYTQASPTFS